MGCDFVTGHIFKPITEYKKVWLAEKADQAITLFFGSSEYIKTALRGLLCPLLANTPAFTLKRGDVTEKVLFKLVFQCPDNTLLYIVKWVYDQ